MFTYTIQIDESLQKRLRTLAEQEEVAIEQVMVEVLDENTPDYDPSRDIILLLAQAAEEEGWSAEEDLSERTREILNHDFPEYLEKRISDSGS